MKKVTLNTLIDNEFCMHDIITVGSAVYDIFVNTSKGTEILRLKHGKEPTEHIAYPMGEKILIEKACFDIGGGATNTATAFSRLGLKTATVCKVGRDFYGKQILDSLKAEKVNFLGKTGNEHTDFSIVLDSKGHDRTILAFKGASNSLKASDVSFGKIKAKWLYISTLLEGSYKTGEAIAAHAKKDGAKIAFNPSTYLAKKGYSFLKGIISRANVLVMNREEAMLISGKKKPEDMLRKLAGYGPEYVVITDGSKGGFAYGDGNCYQVHPHKNAKVVETTGAGDAFASSFVAGLARTGSMEYGLQLGTANAESVIRHFGAHNRLLSWKEAAKAINRNPAKIIKY